MKKVLLIGDYIVDRYLMHTATRLCPEGPVPVLQRTKAPFDGPGGAGLVYAQLQAFGGLEVNPIFTSRNIKERIFADDHLVARIDDDSEMTVAEDNVLDHLDAYLPTADAVIVSDYGKGGITKKIAYRLSLAPYGTTPVFVDAKTNWNWYRYQFAAFPNIAETKSQAWKDSCFTHSVIKCGAAGCSVDGQDVPTVNVPVRDVTGAGDVFLAAFVLNYLETKNLITAAKFANHVAGISVQYVGTHVVDPRELWEGKFRLAA